MVFDALGKHVNAISLRIQDVHDDLKRLVARVLDLPDPESVKRVEGVTVSFAAQFTRQLGQVAIGAAAATQVVMDELERTDSAVRAAIDDLSENDSRYATEFDRSDSAVRSALNDLAAIDDEASSAISAASEGLNSPPATPRSRGSYGSGGGGW